jgi:hypothetical protein
VKPNLRGGDFPLALLLIGISVASIWSARGLEIGTFTRMGPGFVPLALAIFLLVLAVLILIKALTTHAKTVRYAWKPLFIILAGLTFMAVSLERLGLVICVGVLVVIASLAQGRPNWKPTLAVAGFLAVFCYVLFIRALGLPIPAFPA